MESLTQYPKACRESIRRITDILGTCAETAYAMILMTAALMDLRPEDDLVVEYIFRDCGIMLEQPD